MIKNFKTCSLILIIVISLTSLNSHSGGSKSDGGAANMASAVIGAAISGTVGFMMIQECTSTEPPTVPLCVLGGLGLAQAAASLASAAASGETESAASDACPECASFAVPDVPDTTLPTVPGGNDLINPAGGNGGRRLPPGTPIPGNTPFRTVGELTSALELAKGDLTKSGIILDTENGTITDPLGNVLTFDEAQQLAESGAGLSASQTAKVNKLKEDAKKMADTDYKVASMGFDGGGGGSGSGSGYKFKPYEADNSLSDYLKGLQKKGKIKKASIAGMKRMMDGVPIGVQGDNIFQMVTRRYKIKRQLNIFIEPGGVLRKTLLRAPAASSL